MLTSFIFWQTEVIFEVDSSVTVPTLTVVAVGPFPVAEVTRGLIAQNGNSIEVLDVRMARDLRL